MLPDGYSPTDRVRTTEEHELETRADRIPTSNGAGVWIALGIVILLVGLVVVLLSLMPEG